MCGELEYAYTSDKAMGCWILHSNKICELFSCHDKREAWHRMNVGWKSNILWNVKKRFSSGRQTLRCCWPTPSVLTLEQLSVNRPGGRAVKRFLPAKPSTVETDTRGQVGRVKLGACWQQEIEHRHFLGQTSTWELVKDIHIPGTPMEKEICNIWCYFGFLAWPTTSMFSIASRPFG